MAVPLRAASLDVDAPVAARAVAGAPILELRGLARRYGGTVALAGVDLDVRAGETLALVGGSGAGKTTLARIVARLLTADAGTMRFMGADLLAPRGAALRRLRRDLQMVFQDPLAALNPRATIGRLLADPLRAHAIGTARDRRERCAALLERVGLPAAFLDRHPHEISGGQRQRVNIARALATEPKLVVLDEPGVVTGRVDPGAGAGPAAPPAGGHGPWPICS
jgi:peptide/nickel transport system ATP-binding protein